MSAEIKIFISSTMDELRPEREKLAETIRGMSNVLLTFSPWRYEKDAIASTVPAREGWQRELRETTLYIGLFWNEYGKWTIDEYEYACDLGIDRLIFVKNVDNDQRDDELAKFLKRISDVKEGLSPAWFTDLESLCDAVKTAIPEWVRRPYTRNPGDVSATLIEDTESATDVKLIGRVEEVKEIHTRLEAGEVVLIEGFPGMGKTALAHTVTAKYIEVNAGPVLWLTLGDLNLETAFQALAAPFNAQQQVFQNRGNVAESTGLLRTHLKEKGVQLLVLDNVMDENVLEHILGIRPNGCAALVTSRKRIPLDKTTRIKGLLIPQAIELLEFHAGTQYPNGDGAETLCDVLDGHPYMIEIAGKLLKIRDHFKPGELAEQLTRGVSGIIEDIDTLLNTSIDALEKTEAKDIFLRFGNLFAPRATPKLLALCNADFPVISSDMVMRLRTQLDLDNAALSDLELERCLRHAMMQKVETQSVEEALRELEKHGLARCEKEGLVYNDIRQTYYEIHSLSHIYAVNNVEDTERAVMKIVDACMYYSEYHRKPNLENFTALLAELDNLILAAQWAIANQHTSKACFIVSALFARGSYLLGYGGFFEQAENLLQQVADATKGSLEAIFRNHLGIVYRRSGRVDDAIKAFKEALEIAEKCADRELIGQVLGDLAIAYHEKSEYDKALKYFKRALDKSTDRIDIARHLSYQGVTYADMGSYDNAKVSYDRALKILNSIEGSPVEHELMKNTVLGNIGNAYFDQGDLQEAMKHYDEALVIARRVGDRRREGRHLGNIGNVHFHLGEYDEALERFQEALAVHRKVGDLRREGRRNAHIANVYRDKGDFDSAKEHYNAAADIMTQIGDRHGKAYTFNGMGVYWVRLGQIDLAIQQHEMAHQLADEIGNKRAMGHALNGLGAAHTLNRNYAEAESYYKRGRAIAKEIGNVRGKVRSLNGLGEVAIHRSNLDEAMSYINQAHGLAITSGNQREKIYALNNLGFANTQKGSYDEAKNLIEQGLLVAEKIGFRQGVGDCLFSMGRLYLAMEQREDAKTQYCAAREIFMELNLEHKIKRCDHWIEECSRRIEEHGR